MLVAHAIVIFLAFFGSEADKLHGCLGFLSSDSLDSLDVNVIEVIDFFNFWLVVMAVQEKQFLFYLGIMLPVSLVHDLVEQHGPRLRLPVHAVLAVEWALLHLLELIALEYELVQEDVVGPRQAFHIRDELGGAADRTLALGVSERAGLVVRVQFFHGQVGVDPVFDFEEGEDVDVDLAETDLVLDDLDLIRRRERRGLAVRVHRTRVVDP